MTKYQKDIQSTDLYKGNDTEYIESNIFAEYPQIKEILDDIF